MDKQQEITLAVMQMHAAQEALRMYVVTECDALLDDYQAFSARRLAKLREVAAKLSVILSDVVDSAPQQSAGFSHVVDVPVDSDETPFSYGPCGPRDTRSDDYYNSSPYRPFPSPTVEHTGPCGPRDDDNYENESPFTSRKR